MSQDRFEEEIKKKFQNQSVTPPPMVWDNIERDLDKQLLGIYISKNKKIRLVSIAAAILLLLSSVGGYIFMNQKEQPYGGKTYNALLDKKINQSANYPYNLGFDANSFSRPIYVYLEKKNRNNQTKKIAKQFASELSSPQENILPSNILRQNAILLVTEEANYYWMMDRMQPVFEYKPVKFDTGNKKTTEDKNYWASISAGFGSLSAVQQETSIFNNTNPTLALNTRNNDASSITVPTSDKISSNLRQGTSQSINLGFGLELADRWSLESGFSYTSIKNDGVASLKLANIASLRENTDVQFSQIEKENLGDNGGRLVSEEPKYLDAKVNVNSIRNYASIPLKIGYTVLDKKINIAVNAGVSTNYLISNRVSDHTAEIVNGRSNSFQSFHLEGLTGIRFRYSIQERLNLTLEPSYRHFLGNNSKNTHQAMVMTGLSYSIK